MPESLLDQPTVYGRRAKLGVIVPPTNTANEAEWNQMIPTGVSVHAVRMPLHTDTTSETGRNALYTDIIHFSADLAQAGVDVIVYGCTAGSMVDPVTAPGSLIQDKTGIPGLTTAQAIVDALRALAIERLVIATPYHDALNQHEMAFLHGQGFSVIKIEGLGYGENGPQEYRNIARIQPQTVLDLVERIDDAQAQAVLISCTDLTSLPVIKILETQLQKPVISSNTATLWRALRMAGINDALSDYGVLLQIH